jgi:hypothetical protein
MARRNIDNTRLFNELLNLEPEYYKSTVKPEYFDMIREEWRKCLLRYNIRFSPTSFHYNRKHDRIELDYGRSRQKEELFISKDIPKINLKG